MTHMRLDMEAVRRLDDPDFLTAHIARALHRGNGDGNLFPAGVSRSSISSSVLLPLGSLCGKGRGAGESCVILNKRSRRVRQPGDLCFPGGAMNLRVDSCLGRLLSLPGFPLAGWPYWSRWRRVRPQEARRLSLLLATALREGLEEMRLNPLGIRMLGPLPSQNLQMAERVIYPMVGWIRRQTRFYPNWEVERIVYIPLKNLLAPELYACYRLQFDTGDAGRNADGPETAEFPCFIHRGLRGTEILWGATFRILAAFLETVFGFQPPPLHEMPVVHGTLGPDYLGWRKTR